LILARVATSTADGERHNPNYVAATSRAVPDVAPDAPSTDRALELVSNRHTGALPVLASALRAAVFTECAGTAPRVRSAIEGSPFVSIGSVVMIGAHWSLNKGT